MKKLSLLLLSIIILTFTLTACSNNETFTSKEYSSNDIEIKSIIIETTDREIIVMQSNDNQIHLEYFDSEKHFLDINIQENNELFIKLNNNTNWTDYIGTKAPKEYRTIKVFIPDNIISQFTLSTTNENVQLVSLNIIENVNINANNGNILCDKISVGKEINLTTKNGDISGMIKGSWDEYAIHCNIKKGDCNLPEIKDSGSKTFNANCNNGNIDINFES